MNTSHLMHVGMNTNNCLLLEPPFELWNFEILLRLRKPRKEMHVYSLPQKLY